MEELDTALETGTADAENPRDLRKVTPEPR